MLRTIFKRPLHGSHKVYDSVFGNNDTLVAYVLVANDLDS